MHAKVDPKQYTHVRANVVQSIWHEIETFINKPVNSDVSFQYDLNITAEKNEIR